MFCGLEKAAIERAARSAEHQSVLARSSSLTCTGTRQRRFSVNGPCSRRLAATRRRFTTKADARVAVFVFVEGRYTPTLRQSRLDQVTARVRTAPFSTCGYTQARRTRLHVKAPRTSLWITAYDPTRMCSLERNNPR